MKVLKTIVATAVIVFTLTTAAMAGVQHFTKQSSQTAGAKVQSPQPASDATPTVERSNESIAAQTRTATRTRAEASETRQGDRALERDQTRDRTQTCDRVRGQSDTGAATSNSTTGTCVPHDYDHDYDHDYAHDEDQGSSWNGSGEGQHHSGDGDQRVLSRTATLPAVPPGSAADATRADARSGRGGAGPRRPAPPRPAVAARRLESTLRVQADCRP